MSEDRMIHRERTSPTSKEQKNERDSTHKSGVFPRHAIAVNLGILCILLLLRTTVLGYLYFQPYCICKTENCPARNDTSSTEEHTHSNLPTYTEKIKDCDIHQEQWSCCGKSCYWFSTEEKTWDESKTSCQQIGYNLIKIDDLEEQRFIQSQIKNSYWVGLQREGENEPWRWQDGSSPWTVKFEPTTATDDARGVDTSRKQVSLMLFVLKILLYICEKMST